MNPKFLAALKHWSVSLMSACVRGGATALKAFMAAAGASAAGAPVAPLNIQQGLYVFAAAAAYEAVTFLSVNPLPDDDDLPAPPPQ